MDKTISVVINTYNEEKNIERAIKSVKWAQEIIVCDMYSDDNTAEVAKKMGAKVYLHKKLDYVEPARNFAISKASNEWILVLDPDEEIPEVLKERLMQIAGKMKQINYVKIPRKNIIFGKWMRASMWWPDLNIRFFRKGVVKWGDKIHRPPEVTGEGLDLAAEEKWAIVHHNYQTVAQFIDRMNRYTTVEANQLKMDDYQFKWTDLIHQPTGEFLSRFFANKGYEDGLHGLALSLLQALSFLIVYLKVWESEKFKEEDVSIKELETLKDQSGQELNWWFKQIFKGETFNIWKKFKEKIF